MSSDILKQFDKAVKLARESGMLEGQYRNISMLEVDVKALEKNRANIAKCRAMIETAISKLKGN